MNLTIGMRVVDTYTGEIGHVVAIDEAAYRVTVAFAKCRMTGCPSWFAPAGDDG